MERQMQLKRFSAWEHLLSSAVLLIAVLIVGRRGVFQFTSHRMAMTLAVGAWVWVSVLYIGMGYVIRYMVRKAEAAADSRSQQVSGRAESVFGAQGSGSWFRTIWSFAQRLTRLNMLVNRLAFPALMDAFMLLYLITPEEDAEAFANDWIWVLFGISWVLHILYELALHQRGKIEEEGEESAKLESGVP